MPKNLVLCLDGTGEARSLVVQEIIRREELPDWAILQTQVAWRWICRTEISFIK